MTLILALFAAAVGLALGLAACSRGEPHASAALPLAPVASPASATSTSPDAPIEVTDDAGRLLRLARPARRIVAVSPHITELLFAAGAGAAVVGVDAWSDYPAAARNLPRVGDLHALDLERIVALKPDLLVVWGHGNSQRQLEVLSALGLPYYIDEPRRLADIPRSLERLGRLAGQAEQAAAEAARLRAELARLAEAARGQAPVTVFYQVWNEPLLTLNDQTLIGDVIRLCGGHNIFGRLPMQAPQVGVEAVIEADPEVIVAAGFGAAVPVDSDPAFAPWLRWPQLKAMRRGQFVSLPDDLISRQGPRIVEGARALCGALAQARAHQH
ncbi:MAG: hypothetical protein RL722_947 [Pseudomonadota bacterium]